MSKANEDVLRRIGVAFAAGDLEAMSELVAADFESHDHGVPEGYVRHGPGAIFDNVEAIRAVIPDVSYQAREVRVVDDRRLAVRMTVAGQGRWSKLALAGDLGHVWTFEGGRATRLEIYRSWEEALDAVGLTP